MKPVLQTSAGSEKQTNDSHLKAQTITIIWLKQDLAEPNLHVTGCICHYAWLMYSGIFIVLPSEFRLTHY